MRTPMSRRDSSPTSSTPDGRRLAGVPPRRYKRRAMQAAEALVLAGVVAALYWALTPLRRRIEAAIARRLSPRGPEGRGQVVVLARRGQGTVERKEGR